MDIMHTTRTSLIHIGWILLVICSLFSVSSGQISLAEEVRQIKETLRQRDALDQQQRAHLTRVTENLQALTATMERYVTLLEGEDGDGDGVGSCSTRMALLQNRMNTFQESVTRELSDMKNSLGNCVDTEQRPVTTSPCTHTLASIQPAVNVRRGNKWRGFWGRDVVRNDSIIYVGEGSFSVFIIREYLSEEKLQQDQIHRVHNLTEECRGPSIVVRDRRLVCGKSFRDGVFMFDLDTDQLIKTKNMSNLGLIYHYDAIGDIDIAADDTWIWTLYAPRGADHLLLDKLNPETLDTVDTYETEIIPRGIGETFMICGTLYSTNHPNDSPTFIKHIYNPEQGVFRTLADGELVMPSLNRRCGPNWPAFITMLNYDPWKRALYARNCGYHMERYPIEFS